MAQECNPYLMEDTGDLWEKYVKRDFRNKVRLFKKNFKSDLLHFQTRDDMESFREMYERCQTEREDKLSQLKV